MSLKNGSKNAEIPKTLAETTEITASPRSKKNKNFKQKNKQKVYLLGQFLFKNAEIPKTLLENTEITASSRSEKTRKNFKQKIKQNVSLRSTFPVKMVQKMV